MRFLLQRLDSGIYEMISWMNRQTGGIIPMRSTMILLMTLALPLPVASADLQAGVATVDITPPVGSVMYGYGARGSNVSEGVHDSLYAKAIVLDDGETRVAIVTLDLGAFTAENTRNVRGFIGKRANIDHVICVASHTHSAPRATLDFPNRVAPWIRDAEVKIANAIKEANTNLRPAHIGAGWGEVREGHNRRNILENGTVEMMWGNRERLPTSPVDYSLGLIRVSTTDGKPIATLVNFACHPVVLGPENLEISADYPGVFMRLVEAETGAQCMFLPGAPGDINPFWDKTPPKDGAFEQMEKMGKAIADETIRVLGELENVKADTPLSIQKEIIFLADRRDVTRENKNIPAEINTLLIGDEIALATFPGEFFVEHGLRLREQSKVSHTFFVGYANDQLAYFPTIKATTEGGYGAASATRVEIGAGERLVNRALVNLHHQAGLVAKAQ